MAPQKSSSSKGSKKSQDPLDSLLATQASEREGERVPVDPAMMTWSGRFLFVIASVVYAYREQILPWAAQYAYGSMPAREPDSFLAHIDSALAFPAQGFHWLLSPAAGFGYFEWGLLAAWLVLLAELVSTAAALVTSRPPTNLERQGTRIFRIRPPGPFAVEPGSGDQADPGELYRSLHGVLSGTGGQHTRVTLLLDGRPDRPTRLSTAVHGEPQTQSWFDILRSTLRRQEDGVTVDESADLLHQAAGLAGSAEARARAKKARKEARARAKKAREEARAAKAKLKVAVTPEEKEQAGQAAKEAAAGDRAGGAAPVWLAFCELGPRLGPEYPIRLDEGMGESLMALLITSSQPRGEVSCLEYQVVLHPRNPQLERRAAWRIRGERRVKKLRRRDLFQVTDDTRMLEEKLTQPSLFAATIRLVAVAETSQAARAALDPLISALQQFTTQSVRGEVQRLVPRQRGIAQIKRPSAFASAGIGMLSILGATLSLAGLAVGAGGVLLLHQAVWIGYGLAVLASGLALWGVPRMHNSGVRMALTRAPRPDPPQRIFNPVLLWRSPALFSASELAGLWGLPPKSLTTSVEWLPCRIIPASPAVMRPKAKVGDEGSGIGGRAARRKGKSTPRAPTPETLERPRPPYWIAVGEAWRTDGSSVPVGTYLNEFRKVYHVTAGMGAGKSRLAANLIQQFISLETGFVLIDGKGDDVGGLTMTVRKLIPRDQEHRVVIIDLLDAHWMVGLNPLMGVDLETPGAVDRVLGQVRSIFERIDPSTWSKAPGMQQFLDMAALLVLYGQEKPNLAHVSQAIVDEAYRVRLLPTCANTEVRQFWEIQFPELGDSQKSSMHALMRRFDQLLVPELTRFVTTSPTSFDLVKAMEEQRIILVPVPHITLGGLASSVAMLVFQAVIRAAFQRAGSDQSRLDYPLIIDELQVIAAHGAEQDMELALSQLRAQGIPAFYLHQALVQIGDLRDLMLNNAANRLILRAQEPDASVYANQYPGSGLSPADISGQDPMEHQYAIISTKEGPQGPFSIRPLTCPAPVEADASDEEPAGPHPDWKRVQPKDMSLDVSPDRVLLDKLLLQFMALKRTPEQTTQVMEWLAAMPEDEWNAIIERWSAIRQAQRAYILRYPACIRDRLERQQWLSRLENSDGSLMMAVAYKRARPEVAVPPPKAAGKGAKGAKPAPPSFAAPVERGDTAPDDAAVVQPGAFQGIGTTSFRELAQQRGSRRTSGDGLGKGFDEDEEG